MANEPTRRGISSIAGGARQWLADIVRGVRGRLTSERPSLWRIVARWRRFRDNVEERLRVALADPERRLFVALLAVAGILRLAYLDLVPFGLQQAHPLIQTVGMLDGGHFPLTGVPTETGLAPPPLGAYLLLLPLSLGRDPRLVIVLHAGLHVAAIAELYIMVRKYYGLRVAILASALLATAPWAVLSARDTTARALQIPLAVAWLHAVLVAVVDRKPWGWVLGSVLVALSLGTGFWGLPIALISLVVLLCYPGRIRWLQFIIGCGLSAILLLPYLYYENQVRLYDVRQLLDQVRTVAQDIAWHLKGARASLWAYSGGGLSSLAAPSTHEFGLTDSALRRLSRIQGAIWWLSLPSLILLTVVAWSRWRERQESVKYLVPALGVWLPLLAPFSLAGVLGDGGVTPHELVVLQPIGFLALGVTIDAGLGLLERSVLARRAWAPIARLVALMACLALPVWAIYQNVYLYGFLGHHNVAAYGTPYRFWRRTVNLVRREVRAAPSDQVWVYAEGTDSETDEWPALLDYLLSPGVRTVFFGDGDAEGMYLPAARPGLYLLARPSPKVEATLRLLGDQELGEVLYPDGRSVRLHLLEARGVDEMLDTIRTRGEWALDSGLRLVGYDWPPDAQGGAPATLATYWTFVDIPSDVFQHEYDLMYYLVDESGERLSASRGLALDKEYWEPGYLLKQWATLSIPASAAGGQAYILVALERRDDGDLSLYVDEKGYPLGEAIPLGPLDIGG